MTESEVNARSSGRPTMQDVADRAGVSRALVSIVFRDLPGASEQSRERVRQAADDLGFSPDRRARMLSRRRTRLLGITFTVGAEFHNDLIEELYTAAEEVGYEIVLGGVTSRRPESAAVADLVSLRCDALLLLGPTMPSRALERIGRETPTVVLARPAAGAVNCVRTDDTAGAALATRHLIESGHRRVVHVDGGRAPGAAQRRRGYRRAMEAAGLGDLVDIRRAQATEIDGGLAADGVLAQPGRKRPTAAFVFNDRAAAGYLATLRAADVAVPEEHSVVGFDDSRVAGSPWVRLTTVAQDVVGLARSAVAEAVASLDGGTPPRETLMVPRLVVRDTSGPFDKNAWARR